MGGRAATLPPAIHAAHRKIIQQVKGDEIQQAQRRAEIQSKIDILKSENENLSNKKSQKDKELQHEESKIEEAKAEVAAIRNDPSRVTKQQGSPMVSFIIGLIIIILLTIYLFVFYSSTAFSAFFKEYAPSDLGVLGKIFDAQAIPEAIAMSQGGFPTALVFIITIPAVFLGLGYLIHRISNDPNSTKLAKYIKTGSLLLVTFAFDALLAEQIDENIYNAIKNNSFEYMADFKFTMAFQDARFWMIIFAGFIVYLIWGLVFNFIMEEYFKLDRVKVAIEELEKKINQYKTSCKEIKLKMADLDTDISKNNGEIRRYENSLAGAIVLKTDIDLEISNFVNGWLAYMEFKHFSESEKREVVKILIDLSDRIDPQKHPATPEHADRDMAIVQELINYFKKDMKTLGTSNAKGRFKVYMYPYPEIANIECLQQKLIIDFSQMEAKEKKVPFDNMEKDFSEALEEIYTETIRINKYPGSDIWRFFKNDVDLCISKDTNYRNILVILTDGYIYDEQTTAQNGSRVQNLTGKTIRKYRTAADPIYAMEKDDFGLITSRDDLHNLEVLILEVSPENNNQKDEDILKYCIEKWLKEMGTSHYAVYKTDLPTKTSQRIESFIKQ